MKKPYTQLQIQNIAVNTFDLGIVWLLKKSLLT